ncbi:hypothetical protein FB381_3431 [Nocardioides albertanoniae]|uniref:Uncharacterized protein n=1 Tax=Nocardioides albertanoniae TaxID=1175486 RepID=A0A543AAA0_9ACTN|nr:hypothetical protein FB381_3431 [Nocardioides albertanoniae]
MRGRVFGFYGIVISVSMIVFGPLAHHRGRPVDIAVDVAA